MYIKDILIQNYGALKEVEISTLFDESNPKPIVLIGENGSGKTLLLSNIVDAFIELKRQHYSQIQEVDERKYFKVGKKDYITTGMDYSYVNIEFIAEGVDTNYTDVVSRINHDEFKSKHSTANLKNFDINNENFVKTGFYRTSTNNPKIKDCFEQTVLLYFPFNRYENPAWLNKDNSLNFRSYEKFVGMSDRNIVKTNVIKEIETWILDLLLDKELYEKQFVDIKNVNAVGSKGSMLDMLTEHFNNNGSVDKMVPLLMLLAQSKLFMGYSGTNNTTISLINELLTIVYKTKYRDIEYARMGVSEKSNRAISVIIKEKDKSETVVAPTFSHFSSGETMLLALFCSVLKEYDMINKKPATDLSEVKGIVLIDEIDLHLHIEFQKEILPQLISKFPRVQFIISTHSPFFLLGLEQALGNGFQLINLPFGNEISVNQFSEFEQAYNIFIDKNDQFLSLYNNLSERLLSLTRPLIVTEGKTDWKHLKVALNRLRDKGEFVDLEVDFLEFNDDMGDSELKSLCVKFAKMPHPNKIIFMFDRDVAKIVEEMNGKDGFKYWNNNVYSFCIPIPTHRTTYSNISIEFYYTDDEIKTPDKQTGKRLHFTNEISIVKSATNYKLDELIVLDNAKEREEVDKKIYDQDVEKLTNSAGQKVGLSKTAFANKVYEGVDGFNNFDVSEFKKIFEVIDHILKN